MTESTLVSTFLKDRKSFIDAIQRILFSLEKNQDDRALIDEAFRLVHSLKSEASYLKLTDTAALAHEMEDTLHAVRKGELALSLDVLAGLLDAVDSIEKSDPEVGESMHDAPEIPAGLHEAAEPEVPVFSEFEHHLLREARMRGERFYRILCEISPDSPLKYPRAYLIVNNLELIVNVIRVEPPLSEKDASFDRLLIYITTLQPEDKIVSAFSVDEVVKVDLIPLSYESFIPVGSGETVFESDAEEDAAFGKGRRGDELPEGLRRRASRLEKIREAKAALEAEARERAAEERKEYEAKQAKPKERGGRGRPPAPPPEEPVVEPKAQRNFTDPDSRIMQDGATKSFAQCYNAQAAVDAKAQVIVAARVTQASNDKEQLEPLIGEIAANTEGEKPRRASADAGYFSEANVEFLEKEKIDGHIATGRMKHGERAEPAPRGRIPAGLSPKQRMARKLRTLKGRATYRMRKAVVEPVFGQIKAARGFRQFLLRGLEKVRGEWALICATHNLLKLHKSGRWKGAKT
jgi:chemotaxis protein histidine kinase CheA